MQSPKVALGVSDCGFVVRKPVGSASSSHVSDCHVVESRYFPEDFVGEDNDDPQEPDEPQEASIDQVPESVRENKKRGGSGGRRDGGERESRAQRAESSKSERKRPTTPRAKPLTKAKSTNGAGTVGTAVRPLELRVKTRLVQMLKVWRSQAQRSVSHVGTVERAS